MNIHTIRSNLSAFVTGRCSRIFSFDDPIKWIFEKRVGPANKVQLPKGPSPLNSSLPLLAAGQSTTTGGGSAGQLGRLRSGGGGGKLITRMETDVCLSVSEREETSLLRVATFWRDASPPPQAFRTRSQSLRWRYYNSLDLFYALARFITI